MVGVEIEKGEQRTDWLRRPLSDAQLTYAASDVKYLPEVRRRILARATERGRVAWITEEMQRYEEQDIYAEADPYEVHERVKVGGRLTGEQRAVLRELAAWREESARHLDRPRRTVLDDETRSEIARRMPADVGALGRIRVPDAVYRRSADALIEAVARGRAVPQNERPYHVAKGPEEEKMMMRTLLLQALLGGRGARQGVDPALVASKADLRALAEDGMRAEPEEHALLRGWRRAFIGYDLVALLAGRAGVILDPEDGWPRFRALE
jgi:ribonuclease D